MTTDQIVLLVVCGVLAISSAVTGILVFRQSGHKPHLFTGIGWALMAIALYVSGLASLLWQAIEAILVWATGLSTNVVGGVGLAVLALGALMVIISRIISRRTKAKLAARRPIAPPTGSPSTSSSSSRSSSESTSDTSSRPSMARRLGRMARTISEGASSTGPAANNAAARDARPAPAAPAPAPLPPSKPSRPLLDMGEEWNTLDLDTPAAAPAPTASGAPLPMSPASGAAPAPRPRSSADDEVQQIQSALRPRE